MDALLKIDVIIKVLVFRTLCFVVSRIALATDCCCCCCWWTIHRVRRQLIDDRVTNYRDLLENVSCSPGIQRWYRVIGIFLTISPGNRRYSSIAKNRNLLHKYLVVPITTHTHVRRKSIGKKNRKDRRRKRSIIFWFKITLCQAEACAHFSYLLWAIHMAVRMPGHGDLTALLMSWMSLLWRSGHQLQKFITRSSVWYELRSHGKFWPYGSCICKKNRENIIMASLGFWPNKRMKSEFQRFFSVPHKRERGDYLGTASTPWLFHHYTSESNTHCFGLISGFFPRLDIMLEWCQS